MDILINKRSQSYKILLVFPGPKEIRDVCFPLPLLYIAAPLLKAGYQVDILDTRLRSLKEISLQEYLCVGISTMTGVQIRYALQTAQYIRNHAPNIPLIWGGPHPSALPEQSAKHPLVDVVVKREGEETFLEFVETLAKKKLWQKIKGITFEKDGEIFSTPERDPMKIDVVNHLPYDLLEIEKYSHINEDFEYLSSKGCPYNCGFCSNAINYYGKWKGKSPEVIIEELDYILDRFKPTSVAFIDGNFFVNRQRVEKLCHLIINKKLELKFSASIRAEYLNKCDDEFLKLLKKAGFTRLAFGAESGSERMLSMISKNSTVKINKEAVRILGEHEIIPVPSFVIGLPGETREDLIATINLYDEMLRINPNTICNGIFIFTPYPGTPFTHLIEQNYSWIPPGSLAEWADTQWSDAKILKWIDKKNRNYLESISIIARLFYVRRLMQSCSFKTALSRHRSLLVLIASYTFNFLIAMIAEIRWRFHLFKFPIELRFWQHMLYKFKGNR